VATHNHNGGRTPAHPDEDRPSWRPQDQPASQGFHGRASDDDRDYRSWRDRNYRDDDAGDRDPRRWEGSRGSELGYFGERGRSTENYGQGQSGYSAGRYGDDRSQRIQNRNEMFPPGPGYGDRYRGSFDDRYQDLGTDDQFTGRGSSTYWQDRGGADASRYGSQGHGGYAGRGSESERHGPRGSWSGAPSGYGYDDRLGYQGNASPGTQQMGYQGYGGAGTGPHRGKGPSSYRRSDERLRELICESLADDDQLDATHIEVAVNNGEVTLSGSVDDRRAKRDAEDCVASVSGVRDIQNQLRVKDRTQPGKSMSSFSTGSTGMASGHIANGKIDTEALSQDKKHHA